MKLSTKLILICCSVWFVSIIGRWLLYGNEWAKTDKIINARQIFVDGLKQKGWTDSAIHIISNEGSGYIYAPQPINTADCLGYPNNDVEWLDTISNDFQNHSQIPSK